jgi:hypothetical protein
MVNQILDPTRWELGDIKSLGRSGILYGCVDDIPYCFEIDLCDFLLVIYAGLCKCNIPTLLGSALMLHMR